MNTTTRVEHFKNLVRGAKYDEILALANLLAEPRYGVENQVRERFELEGVPVTIDFIPRG